MALYKLPQEKYEQLQIILTEISADEINEVLDSIFLKNKELIKKYYMEQYAGKYMFPPIRRYGVEDAEKDTRKLLNTYEVTTKVGVYNAIGSGYNNPALLLDDQDLSNFNFMYHINWLVTNTKDILKFGYKDITLFSEEVNTLETFIEAYDSGEIQEVINYYKLVG